MPKIPCIVILDDDPDRIREMARCLTLRLPTYERIVFDNAPEMISWLAKNLEQAQLVCLDHDLGPNRNRSGEIFDPGTGRDVANYLATRKPTCPIIIHTTNSLAAPGMTMVLDDSGWKNERIAPYNDLEWISAMWIKTLAEHLAAK
jgi:hypothetical protein